MEIILRQTVHKLGTLGDRVQVRRGYGRNYLIPQGLAVPATDVHIQRFEAERVKLEKQQRERQESELERIEALNALPPVEISRKAGPEGKLFGSVNQADIAKHITQTGVALRKQEVALPDGPLRVLGEHPVTLKLHGGATATVSLHILAE